MFKNLPHKSLCRAICLTMILCLCPSFISAQGSDVSAVRLAVGSRQRPTRPCDDGRAVNNEALVWFDDQRSKSSIQSFFKRTMKRPYFLRKVGQAFNVYAIRVRGFSTTDLIKLFRTPLFSKDISFVEPNFILCVEDGPDDQFFDRLWGLRNFPDVGPGISAVAAWKYSRGSKSIVVGVIDTGIDARHPDLKNNLWKAPPNFVVEIGDQKVSCPAGAYGFDALRHHCLPRDTNGHGTHVSGIIGAEGGNKIGVVGVNWETNIMSLKAFNFQGEGTISSVAEAIEFAIQAKQLNGVNIRVLNNSYGHRCSTSGDCPSKLLEEEIKLAAKSDILFVASAGETGEHNTDIFPHYPSGFDVPNIVSVAWTTSFDLLSADSNYGLQSVDLGAPGSTIWSTWPFPKACPEDIKYCPRSGTSMSSAYVSGAATLVFSRCPRLNSDQMKNLLLTTVDQLPSLAGKTVSGGRLNVYKAITGCTP